MQFKSIEIMWYQHSIQLSYQFFVFLFQYRLLLLFFELIWVHQHHIGRWIVVFSVWRSGSVELYLREWFWFWLRGFGAGVWRVKVAGNLLDIKRILTYKIDQLIRIPYVPLHIRNLGIICRLYVFRLGESHSLYSWWWTTQRALELHLIVLHD